MIMTLLNEGVITLEDLDDFSDDLKETIQFFSRECINFQGYI